MFLCRIRTLPDDDRLSCDGVCNAIEIPFGRAAQSVTAIVKTAVVAGAVKDMVVGVVVKGATHMGAVGVEDGEGFSSFMEIEFLGEERGNTLFDLGEGDADLAAFGLAEEEQAPRRPTQGCRHRPGGDSEGAGEKITTRFSRSHR